MIELRPYQVEVVNDIGRTTDDVTYEHPTGSGKTVVVLAAACERIGSRARRKGVIIATPQEHIEATFTKRSYTQVRCGRRIIEVPSQLVRAARDSAGTLRQTINNYLTGPASGRNHVLVCTHMALTAVKPPTGMQQLRGFWLFVDEAHHSAANGLSQFVTAWRKAGGRVLFFTATAYRGDELPLRWPEMRMQRRTLSRHMQEGYAPGRILATIDVVKGDEVVNEPQLYGDVAPPHQISRRLIRRMIATWTQSGTADVKPKIVVRLPILRGGGQMFVAAVIEAFTRAGARVLDLSGVRSSDRQRALSALLSEREITSYRQSQYDVLVGIQRVREGLDWPWCSDVYCVGMPRFPVTAAQLLGRATRSKPAWYPRQYAERAALRIFAPGYNLSSGELAAHHVRSTLATCAFLEHSNSAHVWAALGRAGLGQVLPLFAASSDPETHVVRPYQDPRLLVDAHAAIQIAVGSLADSETTQLPPADIYQEVITSGSVVDLSIVRRLLFEQAVASSGESFSMRRFVRELHQMPGTTDQELNDIFIRVLNEFREELLCSVETTGWFSRQVLNLTGQSIMNYADRLYALRQFTVEWVQGEVERFRRRCGTCPDRHSGRIGNWPDTWGDVDHALRSGQRGLAVTRGGLRQFCQRHCARRQVTT